MKTEIKNEIFLPNRERYEYDKRFSILLEDTGRTFNLSMHTFSTFAISTAEAIGQMYIERPEFITRKIQSITIY